MDPWPESPRRHGVARSGTVIWDLVLTPKLPKPGHYTGPEVSAPKSLSLQVAQATSHLQGPSAPIGRPRLVSGFGPVPSQHTILSWEMGQRCLSQLHHCILGRGLEQAGMSSTQMPWDLAELVLLAQQRTLAAEPTAHSSFVQRAVSSAGR